MLGAMKHALRVAAWPGLGLVAFGLEIGWVWQGLRYRQQLKARVAAIHR